MVPAEKLMPFRWRLAEAVAWCNCASLTGDPGSTLRTPELRPLHWNEPRVPYGGLIRIPEVQRPPLVEALAQARADLLTSRGEYPTTPAADVAGGRLLLYFPAQADADATACAATEAFYDVDDVPPWDTWITYHALVNELDRDYPSRARHESYLVSWVPPALIARAASGLPVTMMESLIWADDLQLNLPFVQELRIAHLI